MKRIGFKNLGALVLSGIVVGACSPVAPSVSKLSNASAEKANTTDGSSPLNNISTSGSLSSHPGSSSDGALQQTDVETKEEFNKDWNLVRDVKPSMRLENSIVSEFAEKGEAKFLSNADKVKGHESALSGGKIEIHLVMHSDDATITKEGMDKIKANLIWNPVSSSNKEAHWKLVLASPNTGDVVKDQIEYGKYKQLLDDHLVAVAIAFQTDL